MNTTLRRAAAIAAGTIATLANAQDLTHKAPPQDRPVIIDGATIHTVSGAIIEDGRVVFEDGRITLVDDGNAGLSFGFGPEPRVINARGMHVYPGFIAPDTNLGLTEVSAVRATVDFNETGQFNPEVHAAIAINPDSTLIPVARSNGILSAVVFPSGGRIPGRASFISLDGWTNEDMTLAPDAGLIVSFPQVRPSNDWWATSSESEQRERIDRQLSELDNFFQDARDYLRQRNADPDLPVDLRYEAMRPHFPADISNLDHQRPTLIRAQDVDQITAAITWAINLGLKPVIVGGRDAHLVPQLLLEHQVPVVITGTTVFPKRADSPHSEPYILPQRLQELGIHWCLTSGDDSYNDRNLPYTAARAVAYGLDRDDAIRGISLSAAEIFGLADQLGSIEPGKRATLFIADGDPLEFTTTIHHAFIDGREIDLSNKQTKLDEKYREKYRQLDLIDN